MGLFDPNAEVRTGGFTPCREHLRIVNAEVKVCGTGRDAINFEFHTDNDKKRYKTVTVNSIFSSVIKGMMLGVGINPEDHAESGLREIAFAFQGTEGDAWTTIPKDKEYPEPQYFFPKGSPAMPNRSQESNTFADGTSADSFNGRAGFAKEVDDSVIPF